jgi:hypothetical protein
MSLDEDVPSIWLRREWKQSFIFRHFFVIPYEKAF